MYIFVPLFGPNRSELSRSPSDFMRPGIASHLLGASQQDRERMKLARIRKAAAVFLKVHCISVERGFFHVCHLEHHAAEQGPAPL